MEGKAIKHFILKHYINVKSDYMQHIKLILKRSLRESKHDGNCLFRNLMPWLRMFLN